MQARRVRAAEAVGYTSCGTVEFLLADDGSFYFLEMNTRLQVEHPVTEEVWGVDLAREMIAIALGEPLSFGSLAARGHAIECRVYAEDPSRGFAPSPGLITAMRLPGGPGVRHDIGVEAGGSVPIDYDPMLGKLIVSAPDRNGGDRAAGARARRVRGRRRLDDAAALPGSRLRSRISARAGSTCSGSTGGSRRASSRTRSARRGRRAGRGGARVAAGRGRLAGRAIPDGSAWRQTARRELLR